MKTIINCTLVLAILLSVNVSSAFAFKKSLKTESATPADVSGKFTLIRYGANYLDDVETVAILDYEGDNYHFEPYAPEYMFTVTEGVKGQEALKVAEKFVSFHSSFWKSRLSKIINEEGKTIGYEVRPLYKPFIYGLSNILDIYYFPRGEGEVRVIIRLKKAVKSSSLSGDGPSCCGGGGGN
jgi:hypothetical protein